MFVRPDADDRLDTMLADITLIPVDEFLKKLEDQKSQEFNTFRALAEEGKKEAKRYRPKLNTDAGRVFNGYQTTIFASKDFLQELLSRNDILQNLILNLNENELKTLTGELKGRDRVNSTNLKLVKNVIEGIYREMTDYLCSEFLDDEGIIKSNIADKLLGLELSQLKTREVFCSLIENFVLGFQPKYIEYTALKKANITSNEVNKVNEAAKLIDINTELKKANITSNEVNEAAKLIDINIEDDAIIEFSNGNIDKELISKYRSYENFWNVISNVSTGVNRFQTNFGEDTSGNFLKDYIEKRVDLYIKRKQSLLVAPASTIAIEVKPASFTKGLKGWKKRVFIGGIVLLGLGLIVVSAGLALPAVAAAWSAIAAFSAAASVPLIASGAIAGYVGAAGVAVSTASNEYVREKYKNFSTGKKVAVIFVGTILFAGLGLVTGGAVFGLVGLSLLTGGLAFGLSGLGFAAALSKIVTAKKPVGASAGEGAAAAAAVTSGVVKAAPVFGAGAADHKAFFGSAKLNRALEDKRVASRSPQNGSGQLSRVNSVNSNFSQSESKSDSISGPPSPSSPCFLKNEKWEAVLSHSLPNANDMPRVESFSQANEVSGFNNRSSSIAAITEPLLRKKGPKKSEKHQQRHGRAAPAKDPICSP